MGLLTIADRDRGTRCLLCGSRCKLTFEHVPPKSCYNGRMRRLLRVDDFANLPPTPLGHQPRRMPKGLGVKSLCGPCNNVASNRYVRAYRNAVEQGCEIIRRYHGTPSLLITLRLQSGWFIRQVLMMFLAISPTWTIGREDYDRVRAVASSPDIIAGIRPFRIFMYMMRMGNGRLNGFAGSLRPYPDLANILCYAEVAYPPFGFVLLEEDRPSLTIASRLGLTDITRFLDRAPRTWCTEYLQLNMRQPIGAASLQYQETVQPGADVF